jgi:acyl carrier protein
MSKEIDLQQIIQEIFDNMSDAGLVEKKIVVDLNTELLGESSVLDSIGFVTLFSDLEDEIQNRTGMDVFLVLDEINEFDINSPSLDVGVMVNYIESKLGLMA